MWDVRRFALRLLAVFRPRRAETDLAREIDSHLALLQERFESQGLPPDEARRAARRAFGGIEQTKELHRDARAFRWLADLRQDLRYALRVLSRTPAFTTVAALSLAIGIGASTVMFSVFDVFAVRSLPVEHASQLVNVREIWLSRPPRTEVPYWEFQGLRDGLSSVMAIAAVAVFDRSNVELKGPSTGTIVDTGRARAGIVSGNYFSTLGVQPSLGRTLTPLDDRAVDAHPVAVISHAYWVRQLKAAPDVLAHTLTFNGFSFSIVGVMPRGFVGDWLGRPVDFWVPTMMQGRIMVEAPTALKRPNEYWLRLVGRLEPNATLAQAREASQPVYQRVMREAMGPAASAKTIAQQRIDLQPAARGFSPERDSRQQSVTILTAVAVVILLVVTANIAGLLLSRSAARQREFAVRLAIGAGATRLARQIVTECLVLSAVGGTLGVAFAIWGTQTLSNALATAPVQMFWASSSWTSFDLHLSVRGLIFTAFVTVLAGVAFGIAPALHGRRVTLAPTLLARTTTGTGGSGRSRSSRLLVVAQVALALVVLASAGLLFRSVTNLKRQELGFNRENILLVWTQPSSTGRQGDSLETLWHDIHSRLAAIPGVTSASGSNLSLLSGVVRSPGPPMERMRVEGRPPRLTSAPGGRIFILPGFFATLRVPLVAGREFTEADGTGTRQTVIINETMARFYFDRENPVGRRVGFGSEPGTPVKIVGVAKDFEPGNPRGVGQAQMITYFPYRSGTGAQLVVLCAVLRSGGGSALTLIDRVRDELRRLDPSLAVFKVDTVNEQLTSSRRTG
jgi:putative ABC transport system permease protein